MLNTHSQKILTVTFLCVLILILSNCMNEKRETSDPRGEKYAGSATCKSCHADIYNSYISTAHYLSSTPASKKTIHGSFSKDANVVFYRPALKVAMEQTDSGFYQVAYLDGVARQAARFDMVIGSGRKGQSYLYWANENIFQLPVSYYVPEKKWVNSPGYPPGFVLFNRNIPNGCFECHSSFIKKTATKPVGNYLVDYFDKQQTIYGIDCERCHGPALLHVDFHEKNPDKKNPAFISNIAGLARQEKLAMCAICHSGARETNMSTFYYKPGSKLSDYLPPDDSAVDVKEIDVHGRQYQLLLASKCFMKSKELTCSSCHNPHMKEQDNLKNFSMRCMNCHANPDHSSLKMTASMQTNITNNCIDCHMPAKPSTIIAMQSQGGKDPVPALVRTHYISIYAGATSNFLHSQKR